ncbi:MAG: 50S ribosomal protein L1 [Spirochaetia bacterium]|nr:50S ribosomal protein L1 [Spirochaetia bacterium]
MRRGKQYKAVAAKYDKQKRYELGEAVKLVKDLAYAKFDETVELSVKLNLKKGQSVRDTIVLPNQFAAEKRILVIAKGEKATEAQQAGAAYVGDTDLVQKIQGGWLDFDIVVATPDMMKDVGRLGPVLGRRGIMPNPKTGTVTMDIAGAIKELKQGRVEFRNDKTGVVHLSVGKVSMNPEQVAENVRLVLGEIKKKRPSDVKGDFVKSVAVSSTMGPGVKVDFTDRM